MRTLEATGKSIDEAIFNGLRELQISIDEVEIDIIQQETKGVFGIGAAITGTAGIGATGRSAHPAARRPPRRRPA